MKIFNQESNFYQQMIKVADIVIFGLLWSVCCIPLITIGSSTSAMFKMMFDIRRDKDVKIKSFFAAFCDSFKNSTLIELIQIISGILISCICYLYFTASGNESFNPLVIIPIIAVAFIWFVVFEYAYAYTAYFEQKISITIMNCFYMAFHHFKSTIIMTVLTILLPLMYLIIPKVFWMLLPLWMLVLIPFTMWWKSHFYIEIFKQYEPEKQREEKDD